MNKDYHKEYYQKNKEHWKEYNKDKEKKKGIDTKSRLKLKNSVNYRRRQWIEDNYEKSIYMSVRSRSKREGIEFNLELSDIIIPENCPYLKVPLTKIQHQGRIWTNASLDRIDPTKGYTKGNVEVVSMLANAMKQAATKEQLIVFANSVLERNSM